jgi:hypothetical protein
MSSVTDISLAADERALIERFVGELRVRVSAELTRRREIGSFFIAELDRDTVVLLG